MTEFVTPQLRTVLKTYQNSATKSLQGPGQSLSHHHNNNTLSPGSIVKKELSSPEPLDVTETSISVIPPPPEISQPILSQPDTGRGELYETILEGKPIGCFLLGGEMRLCLPQFLNNVLTDFTLDQINRIFDDLRIFCSQCTPEQLMEFKAAKILPDDVKASGLITRTDAERLCAALLHRSDRCNIDIPKGAFTFKVYHRCFGKCEGICTPDLYSFDKPACIMCLECKGMFSPQKFVGHVHRQKENRTCHWGFDSRNWRDYLLVGLDVENRDKCAKMLDELRDLEQQEILNAQRDMSCLKRKAEMMEDPIMEPPLCKREPLDIPSKKAKIIDESSYLLDYQRYQQALYYAHCAQREQLSAFRPWAPKPILHLPFAAAAAYFSQEPPVLQNPERVVRHSESERFERTFQPNVALAPRKSILSKEREREKEKERERDRERNHSAITNLTISETEIHIKQERPSTPDVIAQSPEEMRITSPTNSSNNLHQHRSRHHHHSHSHQSHNQCTTSTAMSSSSSNTNNNHHTTPAPVSPEEFSGSNEITSSTSPVPNTNINNNGCNNASTPTSNTQQQTTAIVATINQKTADNNMIVCVPSRIHLNNISNNSADAARSPTPPSIREQYSINNNIKTRTIQLQSPPQSSSSLSSNAVGLTSGAAGSVVVKNVVNGAFIGATNSEFELSTDTDEDSLIGEPDSSNMTAPWDIAADALKDAQPSDRDKVLQVIKMLVHDNNQLRQYGIENAKLLQEIRHRDERIAELQQELQHHQRQLALFSPQSSISASTLNSIKQKMSGNGGVIAKAESCLTLRNDLTMMSSAYHQKPETEKIKVPLKKSSRRSPEDTVVVLNQNLHRDEVITEIKTVEINTCSSPSAKSLPTSNTTNSTSAATTTTSTSPDSAEYELKQQQQQHQQQQQQQQQQQHQQQQQQRDVASIKCE